MLRPRWRKHVLPAIDPGGVSMNKDNVITRLRPLSGDDVWMIANSTVLLEFESRG